MSTGNNSSTMSAGPKRKALSWRETSVQWERSVDVPAPSITTNTPRAWRLHEPGQREVIPKTPGAAALEPYGRPSPGSSPAVETPQTGQNGATIEPPQPRGTP